MEQYIYVGIVLGGASKSEPFELHLLVFFGVVLHDGTD